TRQALEPLHLDTASPFVPSAALWQQASLAKRSDPPTQPASQSVFNGTLFDYLSSTSLAGNAGIRVFGSLMLAFKDTLDNNDTATTVFAPRDAAFALFAVDEPALVVKYLDLKALKNLLAYHIVPDQEFNPQPGSASSSSTASVTLLATLASGHGSLVRTESNTATGVTRIGLGFGRGSFIVRTIVASNGVLHLIDRVLLEPMPFGETLRRTDIGTGFLKWAALAGLLDFCDRLDTPVTILAPVNDAMDTLVQTLFSSNQTTFTKGYLSTVIGFHFLPATLSAADIAGRAAQTPDRSIVLSTGVPTDNVTLTLKDLPQSQQQVSVQVAGNGNLTPARIVRTDLVFASGLIHFVSAVLFPSFKTQLRANEINSTVLPVL
ncbi:FAS1 domain-containing protein, partial [Entophlyctis helioformis]